jgi:hypothetical protein
VLETLLLDHQVLLTVLCLKCCQIVIEVTLLVFLRVAFLTTSVELLCTRSILVGEKLGVFVDFRRGVAALNRVGGSSSRLGSEIVAIGCLLCIDSHRLRGVASSSFLRLIRVKLIIGRYKLGFYFLCQVKVVRVVDTSAVYHLFTNSLLSNFNWIND